MKRILLSLIIFFSALFQLNAQTRNTGVVKGKLSDTASNSNLKDATISILDAKDSTLVVYGLTKADGSFRVENIPFGTHLLMASFQGYKEQYKSFSISSANPETDLGSIVMQTQPAELAGVTVRTPPVNIKGDTTEFNASQFKTKPNSSAEDILKKMPGIEVAKDGSVKAQGQDVRRVLVDGKRFFGDDPKMATRNLPTDMIDKIQVFDAQSDQSAFSGFDDGNRETTINIITKKDRRKGYFGKATVGGGTDERYTANVNLSRFNGNRQISFIGQANNTNNQNFSIQDILGTMTQAAGGAAGRGGGGGGMQMIRMGGGGSLPPGIASLLGGSQTGITRTISSGLNYSDVWSKKLAVNGSYFYNNLDVINNSDRFRETFVTGDSSQFNTRQTLSNNKNQNHRFNFEVDYKLDSMNSILIRPSISYQNSDNFNETNSVTTKGKTTPQNDVRTFNNSLNEGYNFNNNVLFRHRFAKRGRSISLNLSQGLNNSDIERNTLSYNNYYRNSGLVRDTTNQVSYIDREGKTMGANLSYTEPITAKDQIELSYNYNYNINNSDQQTMSFNRATGKFDQLNALQSNTFENTNISNRINANYRRQIDKEWNYTLGLGIQRSELTSDNRTKKTLLTQTFNNFFPTFMLQYSKNRTKNLRFNYRGSTRQPGINQLQDVIDFTNILNITSGNPALEQEFNNNISLNYTNFNIFTFKNFVVNINGSTTSNKISNAYFINNTNAQITVPNEGVVLIPGAQFSKPINIDGAYNVRGFVNYGFPIKRPKSNINLTTNLSYAKDVNLINNVKSNTSNYVLGQSVRLTMNVKERFDLNFSSTSTYNWARYTQVANTNFQQPDGDYFTQIFSVEPTYTTKNGFIFSSDFDYLINRGQTEGYNQSIPLWHAGIAKQLFKKKEGEIRLSVFDLLNQNKSITRTVEQNYIEDIRSDVLKRYFMLTFTYNLRKFGAAPQQNNRMNMMRGGDGNRTFRMDRQ
ncbi:MAG TPA: outer membrane beta-barrel protein [Segetibacter sp.]|jgi:hypothetical protein